ncbi:MAG: hypothetical protein HZB55_11275 [Deltaproteobacteria bacterium]|nr:hypothetical protein [Deltaproteobacteria bacterium]
METQCGLFARAEAKIGRIAARVGRRELGAPERGPLWQNVLFSPIYRPSFPYVPTMDKKFWVDGKCNSCRVCAKICPARNIKLEGGRPAWLHRCEQCLACIQWRPKEAIQCGTKPPGYRRYRHPEVELAEILRLNRGEGLPVAEGR